MKTLLLLLLACVVAGTGCSSSKSAGKAAARTADWSSRIGTYTYDQAVADMGKPDVSGESSSGRTAEWVLRRSSRMSFGFGVGGGSYGSHVGTGVGIGTSVSPPPSGDYLQLTFDRENKLKEWKRVRY